MSTLSLSSYMAQCKDFFKFCQLSLCELYRHRVWCKYISDCGMASFICFVLLMCFQVLQFQKDLDQTKKTIFVSIVAPDLPLIIRSIWT